MWISRLINTSQSKQATPSDECFELTPAQLRRFGIWLDFDPAVEAQYESDTGANRVAHMQWAACSGLVMYNAYNLSDMIIHRDIWIVALVLRILVVTPSTLLLVWLLPMFSARLREWAATIGIINATAIPIFLFYLSSVPTSLYSVIEIPLMLVFGSVILVLRFAHAFIFTMATFAMSILAIKTRSDIDPTLQFIFIFQVLTACAWILAGNYKIEAVRRGVYLNELRERLRSKTLERDGQALKILSDTDFLTGVGNRRYFGDEFLLRRRDRAAFALLMIDVDFFKLFNDTYGHPMGDKCLRAVVEALKTEIRSDFDVLARFGGEEFVVILSAVTIESVQEIADRFRAAVQNAMILHESRPDGLGLVSISVGAVFVGSGRTETPQQILSLADLALYEAKHLGRNRSVTYACDKATELQNVEPAGSLRRQDSLTCV